MKDKNFPNNYESLSSITNSSPELNEILVLGDSMADLKFKDLFSEELNKVGYNVKHNRFGKGKITYLDGKGANQKATIFFPHHGSKTVLLAKIPESLAINSKWQNNNKFRDSLTTFCFHNKIMTL